MMMDPHLKKSRVNIYLCFDNQESSKSCLALYIPRGLADGCEESKKDTVTSSFPFGYDQLIEKRNIRDPSKS